jgi:hypothetical protein
MAERTHLHRLDHPLTLRILSRLLDRRSRLPAGYERSDQGAWVAWDALAGSYLSSTEIAVVHIARGCAVAERHGGMPPATIPVVQQAIDRLTGRHVAARQALPGRAAGPANADAQGWPDAAIPEVDI